MCGNHEDAENLVQETFLRAHRSWGTFKGLSAASTWLFTIAARTCRRLHRRKAGAPLRMESFHALLRTDEEGYLDVPPPDEGPLEGALREEARRAVLEGLKTMQLKSNVTTVGTFDNFAGCFQYTIDNTAFYGDTDNVGPLPMDFPDFRDSSCQTGTRTRGGWGSVTEIALRILGDCTVPTKDATWGSVKSLYQD